MYAALLKAPGSINKTKLMKYCLPLLLILFCGCNRFGSGADVEQVSGFVPVYTSKQVINTITNEAAKPTVHPGKIYAYGVYLFQVENNEGIHIIDNSNPAQAKKIGFLKVPLATEIAIKQNFLYTNNLNDLVVFNLANIAAPQLVNRIADAFPAIDQTHPPFSNTYFECPDPAKGIVTAWENKMIATPKCHR